MTKVIDIRTLGLTAVIEPSSRRLAYDLFIGDIIALSSPLIVEEGQIVSTPAMPRPRRLSEVPDFGTDAIPLARRPRSPN